MSLISEEEVIGLIRTQADRRYPALPTEVSVSGGNATLTDAQSRSSIIEVTGATQARTVTFQDVQGGCTVVNSTDYAITVLRSGQSQGIVIEPGGVKEVLL